MFLQILNYKGQKFCVNFKKIFHLSQYINFDHLSFFCFVLFLLFLKRQPKAGDKAQQGPEFDSQDQKKKKKKTELGTLEMILIVHCIELFMSIIPSFPSL